MDRRWAGLAVTAHVRRAIDYSRTPAYGSWALIERVVFDRIEKELVAELHRMIYEEHLATMTALTDNAFDEERGNAQSEYRQVGQRLAPWLRWAPQKTITDLWQDSQERRKDPEHMRRLRELQKELDDEADRIAGAVKEELELRQRAQEARQREIDAKKKPIGRRYVKVPQRRPWH